MSYSDTEVARAKEQDQLLSRDDYPFISCIRHGNHSFSPMELSVENLEHLWKIGKQYKTIFGHMHDDDFFKFISYFVTLEDGQPAKANGLFWKIDDFAGLMYITDIDAPHDCSVHYAFYKSVGSCKKSILTAGLDFLFKKYHFNRVSTSAGLHVSSGTHKQIEDLGFKLEGLKKYSKFFDNKYFHVKYYGLLKSDFYSVKE